MGKLEGQVAFITGAARGQGRSHAVRLAREGADIIAVDICAQISSVSYPMSTPADLAQTVKEVESEGRRIVARQADVRDVEGLRSALEEGIAELGVPQIVLANAGIGVGGPNSSDQDWHDVIAVNLTGVFLACRAAIPYLRAAPHGKIVNIGSATGKRPLPNRTPYAAAKLGVVGLTRTLAHELGPDNISVNTISPFLVDNARLATVISTMAAARGRTPAELRDELTAGTAFGRPVTEDDVARLTLMLCSSAADDLTGQDLNVTAGAVMY